MKTFFKVIIFLVVFFTGCFGVILFQEKDRWQQFIGMLLGMIVFIPTTNFWWDYISKTMDKKDE